MLQYLTTALIAYASYKIYTWTRCPDEIKHLPALPMMAFFRIAFSNDSLPEKVKKDFQPMFDEYGVVRVISYCSLIKNIAYLFII
jgi:hypothetical protein